MSFLQRLLPKKATAAPLPSVHVHELRGILQPMCDSSDTLCRLANEVSAQATELANMIRQSQPIVPTKK